jgi:hypothetical protein
MWKRFWAGLLAVSLVVGFSGAWYGVLRQSLENVASAESEYNQLEFSDEYASSLTSVERHILRLGGRLGVVPHSGTLEPKDRAKNAVLAILGFCLLALHTLRQAWILAVARNEDLDRLPASARYAGLLLFALGALTSLVGWAWWSSPTRDNTMLFGSLIAAILLVYCVSILGWRVTGKGMSFEQAQQVKQEMLATKAEVADMIQLLTKMAAVVADGAGRFGGFPSAHHDQLEVYRRQLTPIVGLERGARLDQEIRSDLDTVRRVMTERVERGDEPE